jgi:RNA polymerase sigma-70 factor (ECF subfamily)
MKKQIVHANTKTDEEIIDLYWNRKEDAIPETDRKYGRYLYTIAYNIVRDGRDCEECINDTYFSTWNRIPPTRPNIFQVFLSKITRNIAVDKYRKNTAEKRIPSEMIHSLDELDECLAHSQSVEEELDIKHISVILNDYLNSLSQKEITLFVCRYYYCDSIESIARMFGTSESTVFRHLAKLKEGLRRRLAEEEVSL